ncbi:riboflavin-binding protein-like isoform X2 [Eublepharis macularius]|uniref:Riboflavin-binding protein-like isoform X2 n=1 Tax=Eublepharis macularius TaxID=481883 RepID=A0AA97JCN6_EUBMA|nr:riboflavin-binding protein-like isoform X2 [Eublepharis macularius]
MKEGPKTRQRGSACASEHNGASCCHASFTKELAQSPVMKVNNTYWNRCGNLSEPCESYMKKMECFYRCSPIAVYWAKSNYSAAIESVPICQKFCDGWYEACKNDFTCVNNWLTDWEIDEKGENRCRNKCIPFNQMYNNGTDMCENMWGNSLKANNSTCDCLNLNENDSQYVQPDSSSSNSSISDQQACHKVIELESLRRKKKKKA